MSERANERFAKKKLIHSFSVINLSESLTVALLSWTTWAIPSWSLFWHDEQPENSLIVAHLSWAIWANRSQSLIWSDRYERMSEFPTLHHLHVSDRWRNSLTLPVGTNDFKQCMSPGEMSNSRDYFVCAHDTVNKNYTFTTVYSIVSCTVQIHIRIMKIAYVRTPGLAPKNLLFSIKCCFFFC